MTSNLIKLNKYTFELFGITFNRKNCQSQKYVSIVFIIYIVKIK